MNFGVSTINIFGPWFVRANVLRDLASLNKVEVIPWEYNEFADKQFNSFDEWNKGDLEEIDKIAALINPGDNSMFSKWRDLYESKSKLQMAGKITSYTPLGTVIVNL